MTRVLVVNAGSSTLKLSLIGEGDAVEGDHRVDDWDGDAATGPFEELLESVGRIDAVGHRVVHGGHELSTEVVSPEVEQRIVDLTTLAPLHQRRALTALEAARQVLADVPHVACFDTAFHATLPAAARTYAIPLAWRQRWSLDRYGFHGLSHAWAARRAPLVADRDDDHHDEHAGRIVSCHLGAGASLCAIRDGRSVDTTMGFTPLEGLVMATRSGSVDPGLILWLLTEGGLAPADVSVGLERHGGLSGLSATGGDMRDVLAARADGADDAALAFDVYIHRLRREIAAMAAALGGVDLLVFTGGVGEHSPPVREAAVAGLGFLGLALDPAANEATTGDGEIGAAGAPARTVVVTSREDLEIAGQVRRALRLDGWDSGDEAGD
ncbi:MAG: acetate/propionate family kinase [Ilumatobacteraceae bacterium]